MSERIAASAFESAAAVATHLSEDEMGGKIPSPCIDVCKFKRAGHCIGCSMTKPQKKSFKKIDGKKAKRKFIVAVHAQQQELGKYKHWEPVYRRKCEKKKVDCPID